MQFLKSLMTASLLAFGAATANADTIWTVEGFDMPESVLFDPEGNRLIVSVMVGAPNGKDGNGHLALLSIDGTVIDLNWAEGLDAPKGMALMNGKLFVSDVTNLRIIDAKSGELLETLPAKGSKFLNDVAANGKDVFVSDMMTHIIWRYHDGEFSKWLETPELRHPNGVYWDNDRLLVGSWGKDLQDDFTTEVPGSLFAIDPETKSISIVATEVGNIDGIVRLDGKLILSDWISGALYEIKDDGSATEIATRPAGLADIGAKGDVLYLPHMLKGKIEAAKIEN
jgi:hypothetical protein